MTAQQCAERQAARDNLVRELCEALDSAIDIIDGLDGRDNSCDPKSDISDLREVLVRAKEQQ
jgi:hypothetical protein